MRNVIEAQTTLTKRFRCWDMINCAAISVFACCICLAYTFSLEDPLQYPAPNQLAVLYPSTFVAAGHGLSRTDIDTIPGLLPFFSREVPEFDISTFPEDQPTAPISTGTELTHIYFLLAIGWFWRLLGVSITTLLVFSAVMYALCACALYGLFRLGLSRTGSVLATVLVCSSPTMLYMSVVFRDFAKAPFLFGFLFFACVLLKRPFTRRQVCLIAALMGVVLGVGMGFRQDFLICIPPGMLALALFSGDESTPRYRDRMPALLVFVLALLITGAPILKGMTREGNQATAHIFFQGIAPDVESGLSFGHGSYTHPKWGDASAFAQVNTYARRHGNLESMVNPHSGEYLRAHGDTHAPLMIDPGLYFNGTAFAKSANALLLEVAFLFPADLVARAWRTVVALYEMPYLMYLEVTGERTLPAPVLLATDVHAQQPPPRAQFPKWFSHLLTAQGFLAYLIRYGGLPCTLLALAAVSVFRFRAALFLTGMLLWFSGYPSLLYEYRHAFYLIFIPLWAIVFCVETALRYAIHILCEKGADTTLPTLPFPHWQTGLRRLAAFFCLLALALLLPLTALRAWQRTHVFHLADTLRQTTRTPVELELTRENGMNIYCPAYTLPGLDGVATLPSGETAWEYVALEFLTHGEDIPLCILYEQDRLLHNFSQCVTLRGIRDENVGRLLYFFPIYETTTIRDAAFLREYMRTVRIPEWVRLSEQSGALEDQRWWQRGKFRGVSIPEQYAQYFNGFYRVSALEHIPVLTFFELPDQPYHIRPYKTEPWERKLRSLSTQLFFTDDKEEVPPDSGEALSQTLAPFFNNDVWRLDKMHLRHQWPLSFPSSLLEEERGPAYLDVWNERMKRVPGLTEIAAEDLARNGVFWFAEGYVEDGMLALETAILLKDDVPLYHVLLGQMALSNAMPDKAIAHFHTAMLQQPFLPETGDLMDALLRQREDTTEIVAFWQPVFDAHPGEWFAGMRAGAAQELHGDYAAAATNYSQVLAAHPEHPDTSIALARCAGLCGDLKTATSLLEQTAAAHPERGTIIGNMFMLLGDTFSNAGEWDKAEHAYLSATHYLPEQAQAFMLLGEVQAHQGKTAQAKESFDHALRLVTQAQSQEQLLPRIHENVEALHEHNTMP